MMVFAGSHRIFRLYDIRNASASDQSTNIVKEKIFELCEFHAMSTDVDWIAWLMEGLAKDGKKNAGLARALGVAPPRVSELLKGTRALQLDEVPAAAAYLEMPLPSEFIEQCLSAAAASDRSRAALILSGLDPTYANLAAGFLASLLEAQKGSR